jgi:hypothetical protein
VRNHLWYLNTLNCHKIKTVLLRLPQLTIRLNEAVSWVTGSFNQPHIPLTSLTKCHIASSSLTQSCLAVSRMVQFMLILRNLLWSGSMLALFATLAVQTQLLRKYSSLFHDCLLISICIMHFWEWDKLYEGKNMIVSINVMYHLDEIHVYLPKGSNE